MASLISAKVLDASVKVVLKGATSDVIVPPLACGTWAWGDRTWNYDAERDLPPIKEVWSKLNKAGLGFLDTAEVYGFGESERIIGNLIKETSEEERKGLVLATKVSQVDLYQVHSAWTYFYSYKNMAQGLAECVKLGLTKTVGVSNFSTAQMVQICDELAKLNVPLASNQIEYNLLRRLPETSGLLAACHERNVVLLAYSPLGQGRLTGKYSVENPPPSGRRFSAYPMEEIEPLLVVMKEIAKERDVPVSAVALNWVMCKGAIPLGGARNAQQAEQNMKSLGWKLSAEEIERLEVNALEGKTSGWQHG